MLTKEQNTCTLWLVVFFCDFLLPDVDSGLYFNLARLKNWSYCEIVRINKEVCDGKYEGWCISEVS